MNKQSLVKNKYQDSESYFSFNEKTLEFKLEQVTNCLQKCYFNLFFFFSFQRSSRLSSYSLTAFSVSPGL